MEIIIDYNNDKIEIQDDTNPEAIFKVKEPQKFQQVLFELLNRIDEIDGISLRGISLITIDEDTKTTVGEW